MEHPFVRQALVRQVCHIRTMMAATLLLVVGLYSAQSLALPTHSLTSGDWSLVTIPADPGATGSPQTLFGDDLPVASYGSDGNWVLYAYDTAATQYVEVGINEPLLANTAYWILQATGSTVEIDVPDTLSPPPGVAGAGCIADALCTAKPVVGRSGLIRWNLAGASTDMPVRLGSTRFVSDGGSCAGGCTPAEAKAAEVAADVLISYQASGANPGYQELSADQSLQPWAGYWLATLGGAPSPVWLLPSGASDGEPEEPNTAPERDAARLLAQASFGATETAIEAVIELGGAAAWIDEQLALPPEFHLPIVNRLFPGGEDFQAGRYQAFWQQAIGAEDQLRQRVAFALSEILVLSDNNGDINDFGNMAAAYQDVLLTHAFGNYRELLQAVTLNPAMGVFLSMLGNDKPDAATGSRADENYARELMQLFTIGLEQLNLDGTSRGTAPTYTQPDVENLARALTGWAWDKPDWSVYAGSRDAAGLRLRERPMKAFAAHHDMAAKSFLGQTLPAGQSPEQDLDAALDIIFAHPNVGPFVSRQLIQRLVTSNPSPEYVRRVASTFNDNGSGERGDLAAVVRAILLDTEARDVTISARPGFGKLREPLLRFSHLWRAFDVKDDIKMEQYSARLIPQVAPLTAPSVFNFFSPDYSPPGAIKKANLVAPEFQINSESKANSVNFGLMKVVQDDRFFFQFPTRLNLDTERRLLATPEQLLDHLEQLLLDGNMSASLRSLLDDYLNQNAGNIDDERLLRDVVGLVITSADHAVQR